METRQDKDKTPFRADVPDEYKYRLKLLYPTKEDLNADLAKAESLMQGITRYKGLLGSAKKPIMPALLEVLILNDKIGEVSNRLAAYAALLYNQDITDKSGQEIQTTVHNLLSLIEQTNAFVELSLAKISPTTFDRLIVDHPELANFKVQHAELHKGRAHQRPLQIEEHMAATFRAKRALSQAFDSVNAAVIGGLSRVLVEDGTRQTLTPSLREQLMESPETNVRRGASNTWQNSFERDATTLATIYAGLVGDKQEVATARKFASAEAMALDSYQLPDKAYDLMTAAVLKQRHVFQRYLTLREAVLKLGPGTRNGRQRMPDLYAVLGERPQAQSYETVREDVIAGMNFYGPEYAEWARDFLHGGFVDVMPNKNKPGGAFVYPVHGASVSFMSLNWASSTVSRRVFVHELGHAGHNNRVLAQPFVNRGHKLVVAETAAILNEGVDFQQQLKSAPSGSSMRRYLLAKRLDGIMATLYRQALFTMYERETFQLVKDGKPLVPEVLDEVYLRLTRKFYAPAVRITDKDPIRRTWAWVPHFFHVPCYVGNYVLAMAASLAILQRIEIEGQPHLNKYLEFLSFGLSKTATESLLHVGVDISNPAGMIAEAANAFARIVDEFEHELKIAGMIEG